MKGMTIKKWGSQVVNNFAPICVLAFILVSCGPKNPDNKSTCKDEQGNAYICQSTTTVAPEHRWMDRQIYLALPNGIDGDRNNTFQKQKVKDALTEIQASTGLGDNYFSFSEVDESLLQPLTAITQATADYKSFILVWPDDVFNRFVINELDGNIPDPYAITVINSANKRKFFVVLKASCFNTAPACNNIGDSGLRAMIARQLGLLAGMSLKNCVQFPTHTMCAETPSDSQWSLASKQNFFSSFNSALESILNSPGFYNVYQPPSTQ